MKFYANGCAGILDLKWLIRKGTCLIRMMTSTLGVGRWADIWVMVRGISQNCHTWPALYGERGEYVRGPFIDIRVVWANSKNHEKVPHLLGMLPNKPLDWCRFISKVIRTLV